MVPRGALGSGSYQLVLLCSDGTNKEALHRFPSHCVASYSQFDVMRRCAREVMETKDLRDGSLASSAGGQSVLSVCSGKRLSSVVV
jgi:hypothetical protein